MRRERGRYCETLRRGSNLILTSVKSLNENRTETSGGTFVSSWSYTRVSVTSSSMKSLSDLPIDKLEYEKIEVV